MQRSREIEFSCNFENNKKNLIARLLSRASINTFDAEDILQKAVLKMWQNYDSFKEGTSFIAWAWTVTRNTMMNFLRARKRCVIDHDAFETVEELLEHVPAEDYENSDPRLGYIELLFKLLTVREKELLRWVYMDGRDIKDFAKAHNLARSTCFNILSLLRKKLKKQINERILLEMH